MDNDMIAKMIRQVLQFGAGALVTRGVLTQSTAELAVGILAAALIAAYVAWRNTKTARIAGVASMPEVGTIVTTPALAAAVPASNVIGSDAVKVSSVRPGAGGVYSLALPGVILAVAMMLGGCSTISPSLRADPSPALQAALAVARTVAPESVARLDRSIADVSGGRLAEACRTFTVAAGYYAVLRLAIPERLTRIGDPAVAAGGDLCAAPPTDTAQALDALNRLWAAVQDATKTR